jgi:hypothetical protein
MLDPQPSPTVMPDERIARFARMSSHLNRKRGRGDYSLFMPAKNLASSVMRRSGLDDANVRALGLQYVLGLPLLAHACLLARVVIDDCALQIDPNGEPYARHAKVIGWTGEKAHDRIHAKKMADASLLCEYQI